MRSSADTTYAKDIEGNPPTVFTHQELLVRKLKSMGCTNPQVRNISKIVEIYPEFEDTWRIELSTDEVKQLLDKPNIRDLHRMLNNWKKKGIDVTLV